MKKMIRLTALLMIMAICFSSLISCGECKHANQTPTVYTATCTNRGYTLWICNDCQLQVRRENEVEMLPHTYDMTKCGIEQKCQVCLSELSTKTFYHDITLENQICTNCKKVPFANLTIPELPITLHEKNSLGNITDSYLITKIESHVTYNKDNGDRNTGLELTVTRIYPTNRSGKAHIAWKLYKNGNEPITDGQPYSNVSIGFNETTTIYVNLPETAVFGEGYSLKFLHLIDT